MNGLSRKIYLELPLPTEDDPRSDQQRILDSLAAAGVEERVHMPVHILRKLYPLLDNAKWKITVSLAWNLKTLFQNLQNIIPQNGYPEESLLLLPGNDILLPGTFPEVL